MSLCFREAFEKKESGAITEQEYFFHLLAHCRGVIHEEEGDGWPGPDLQLRALDPIGSLIRQWSLHMAPVKDVTPFENVLSAYRSQNLNSLKDKIELVDIKYRGAILHILVRLASRDARTEVSEYCRSPDLQYHRMRVPAADIKNTERNEERNEAKAETREESPEDPCKDGDVDSDGSCELDVADFDEGGRFEVDW